MAKGRFENLTIDYRQMLSMPVQDRISIARSDQGQSILSALTPTQYAALFPSYYKDRAVLPNISGFEKALTSEGAKTISSAPQLAAGTGSAPGGTAAPTALSRALPGAIERLAKKTNINISDPQAKAELSREKAEILKRMESGSLPADDPKLAFLKDLKPEDLKRAGIQVNQDGSYSRASVTDEQAKEKLATIDPKIEAIRQTIVGKESSGRYDITSFAEGKGSTASGGYQFADPTWRYQARKIGVDVDLYKRAKDAPRDVQDAVARSYIKDILARNGGDVGAVPREWYAGPKGYLTARELEVNRGMTVDQYVKDWMQKYQANAKATGVGTTATDLAQARELVRSEQEEALARMTEVPEAPANLDPKLVAAFNKMSPGQKQRFVKALEKDGEGTENPTATGVAKLNEALKADPENTQSIIQAGISQQGSRTLGFSDSSVAQRAESLSDATKASLERFKVFAPERTVVTSTYRSPTHPIEAAKRTPGAHARGQAIDVRTNDKTKEELAATVQALKKAGFNYILLEGDHIHAEVRPGQAEVNVANLGRGNPLIDLQSARDAAASVDYNVAMTQEQERRMSEQAALKKIEDEQRPIQQRGLLAYTGQQTSPDKAQLFQQQEKPQQVASLDPAKASQAEQTVVEQTNDGAPIQAFADGGEMNVNSGEISAQPIQAIKGDNSVVVDGNKNPLFTMNTKEETANYDPDTGKVSVEPVSKNNPDSLKASEEKATEQQQNSPTEMIQQNMNQMSSRTDDMASRPNQSFERTVELSSNPIHSASFGRAMAATRMMKSTDGLGGHFDHGAANLS